VAHTYNLSYCEAELRRNVVQSQPGQKVHETLSWKYLMQNRAVRVAQVVEYLPSQYRCSEFKLPYLQNKKKIKKFNFFLTCKPLSFLNGSEVRGSLEVYQSRSIPVYFTVTFKSDIFYWISSLLILDIIYSHLLTKLDCLF
jgi:hypothetical protein